MTLRRCVTFGLIGVCVAIAAAQDDQPRTISVEQQLRLKRRVMLGDSESLLATLQRNVETWREMTPEQRDRLRQQAYALREADPAQQQRMMEAYAEFLQLSEDQREEYRRRAERIEQVLSLLSDEEKQRLLQLPPHERARRIMAMRSAFQAEGRIPPDTQPAEAESAPDTQAAPADAPADAEAPDPASDATEGQPVESVEAVEAE